MKETKICVGKCGLEKPLSEFGRNGKYIRNECKKCRNEKAQEYSAENKEKLIKYHKKYRKNNKEKISKQEKIYYTKNKEKINKQHKKYYNNNKEKVIKNQKVYRKNNKDKISKQKRQYYKKNKKQISMQRKSYRKNNKDKIIEQKKIYYTNNKEKVAKQQKKYRKNNKEKILKYYRDRKKYDTQYKISCNLRDRFNKAIKNNYKTGSAVRDMGCSVSQLKKRLKTLFYSNPKTGEKMSWENYGKNWHIDHIIPLSFFNLEDRKELLIAVNYKNLQPMWAEENLQKSSSLPNNLYELVAEIQYDIGDL